MTIIVRLITLVGILISWNTAMASSLDQQINQLIAQQFNQTIANITITYLTPKPQLSCEQPQLTLLNKQKFAGKVTISAQCDHKTKFIQLNVAISGNYVVAKQAISAGTVITEQHIRLQSGRLDTLPTAVILDKAQALNHIALRNIKPDEPIKTAMLQKNWLVKAGQIVKVIINGDGYQIVTNGKTLNNAVLDDHINVRLNSGNIIEGIVTSDGVMINP
ncbi:flagellar basal body P-ring formation chaperone FlgA [Gilliamella sp. wkB112]|uniref:flagellar basal body P-ring formation chaperone FlgA n=1 Tax=Gilliamella sp. wkB112 TaxID=3120257 RepID=UPI00080EE807|nr:flagellar basal body P-ring formation chaperone FlgA [Gilliamella apicola]OCG05300.1 flagella basal body P-ring formation protein FlgA [Gilliamella apicola]